MVAAIIFNHIKRDPVTYEDPYTTIDSLELVVAGDSLGIPDDECCFADTLVVEE